MPSSSLRPDHTRAGQGVHACLHAPVPQSWDRDVDTIYVLDCFKMSGGTPFNHAARMKSIAASVPVAWPHDGAAREAGSGEPLAGLCKAQGLRMLPSHAIDASGGYSTEAGILEMLTPMRDGRFKVAHRSDWFDEFRGYHRNDGLIVKLNDDGMSATRIAVMARRHANDAPLWIEDSAVRDAGCVDGRHRKRSLGATISRFYRLRRRAGKYPLTRCCAGIRRACDCGGWQARRRCSRHRWRSRHR